MLASLDTSDGRMRYVVPVGRGVQHEYQDMFRSFTCCVGSGMESHALHGDGIYYESGGKLWINLYAPSTANWKSAGMKLAVETDLPDGESVTIKLAAEPRLPGHDLTLALRRPYWAGEGFNVNVNGEPIGVLPKAGSYVELKRTWKTGDSI